MDKDSSTRARIIKTPVHHIPIGVPFKKDGQYGLRIKKPQCQEFEDVPLDHLITMVVAEAKEQ